MKMEGIMSKVIAVNSGSSSLKFQVFDMPSETVLTISLKVKDNIKSCFQILIKNTRGIIMSMNFINSLLILLTPF